MPKTTAALIFILLLLTGLLGYNYFFKPFAKIEGQNQEKLIVSEQDLMNEQSGPYFGYASIKDLVASLEPVEKIAQLMLVPVELQFDVQPQLEQLLQATPSAGVVANSITGFSPNPTANPKANSAASSTANSSANSATNSTTNAATSSPSAELRVISNNLTLSQEDEWKATVQALAALKPGGVTIFGSQLGYQETTQAILDLKQQIPLHPIFAVDHEGGSVQRLSGEGFTQLPSWREQCALEYDQAQELWQQSALELSQVGISMILAPMVDFAKANAVLGSRICSGDTQTVLKYGLGFSDTFFAAGIQPVFKHFPGIGKTKLDLHTNFDTVQVGVEEAKLYQVIVDSPKKYTTAVMVSHVGVKNQFADIPCSLSDACINELKSVEPKVLVLSDALEMKSATNEGRTLVKTIELAIRAGNHVLVFGPKVSIFELSDATQQLVAIYDDSTTFRTAVDRAVIRVLEYKYSMMSADDEID
jgi:beta-glucosidase-like glycosyl hydrolase